MAKLQQDAFGDTPAPKPKPKPKPAPPENLSIIPAVRKAQTPVAPKPKPAPPENLSTNPYVRNAHQQAVAGAATNDGLPAPTTNKNAAAAAAANKVATGITGDPGGGTTPASSASTATTKPAASTTTTGPTAPATTRSVVIPDYKLDPAYQTQLTNLNNTLADYGTARDKALGDYDTTYGQTLRNVGWDPNDNKFLGNNLNTQYGAAGFSNMEDYGGRGMGHSSGYLRDLANINGLFANQVGDLAQQRLMFRTGQNDAYNAQARQTDLMRTQAATEAVSRIAAQLGVTANTVRTNPGLTISVPVTTPTAS